MPLYDCTNDSYRVIVGRNLVPGTRSYSLSVAPERVIGQYPEMIATKLIFLPHLKKFVGRIEKKASFQSGFVPGLQVTIHTTGLHDTYTLIVKNEDQLADSRFVLRWNDLICRPAARP